MLLDLVDVLVLLLVDLAEDLLEALNVVLVFEVYRVHI